MSHKSFDLITTAEALREACFSLNREHVVGFDTETTSLDPFRGRLRLIQLAGRQSGVFVIDLDRLGGASCDSPTLEPLRSFLSDSHPLKVSHNSKFDLKWVKHRLGIDVGKVFDTMLAAQLLDFDDRHSLQALSNRYLQIHLDKRLQSSDWARRLSYAQLEYAAKDAQILLPLHEVLDKLLKAQGLEKVAALEFAAVREITKLELGGISIDRQKFENLVSSIESRRDWLAAQLRGILSPGVAQLALFSDARTSLNLDSAYQLAEAFGGIGISLPQSTRARHLLPLAEQHESIRLLLDYREMQKLASSFGRNILRLVERRTGRLHANYRQIGTLTGRITCENPNLQQLPKEGEIRGVFRAPEGRVIISADYSMFELRVLAEVSGDQAMIKAFTEKRDLHRETAAMIFKSPSNLVTPAMRQAGKHLNLGVVYGLGVRGLARKTGQTEDEASNTLRRFFQFHPELKKWIDRMGREAMEHKQVRTVSGRLIRFKYDDKDPAMVAYVKRLARNAPAQGTAADIVKRALIILGSRLQDIGAQVVNIIHDEVLVEAPADRASEASLIVSSAMTDAGQEFLPNVPIEVKPTIGADWSKES